MIRWNRASLAIHSTRLNRDEITRRLGIEPSAERQRRSSALRAVWTLDLTDDPRESGDHTGMGSLRRLVDVLAPNREALHHLRDDCELRIWWSGDSDSTQGGFVMPADLLVSLGQLDIDVFGTAFLEDEITANGD
ncbi:hypothetical protein ASE14_19195 [Agromyces sp. Root81]|uniref:DUF4279 domain-containing protein n=1 Tax=Agromyces sp. Root81 TaxID=1736601 RepID=UPI0006F7E713|nr:DUF4279 domain-containing protein [Agromyces sp. Root81]KRC58668.1 hypothetical protein ASE14_19195 [Agromyces sp. Root81]